MDSHPEDDKSFEEFTEDDWGNYIADRAVGNHLEDLSTHNFQYSILEISAAELLRDLPPTGIWYWGDTRGHPSHYNHLSSYVMMPCTHNT